MTAAIFARQGNRFAVTINGHAGYGAGGPDVVCAACSVLACTLLQCLLEIEAGGGFQAFRQESRSGGVRISFTAQPFAQARAEAVAETIAAGFALLAASYPNHVKLAVRSGEKGCGGLLYTENTGEEAPQARRKDGA